MKEFHLGEETIIFGTYEELGVHMYNLCYTIVTQDMFDKKKFYIAYDQKYVELSPSSQKFLLFHEIGHIVNGDFEKKYQTIHNKNILRTFGISNKMEFNADKFAVKRVGKKVALNCLFEMKKKNIFTSSLDLIQRAIVIIFG